MPCWLYPAASCIPAVSYMPMVVGYDQQWLDINQPSPVDCAPLIITDHHQPLINHQLTMCLLFPTHQLTTHLPSMSIN